MFHHYYWHLITLLQLPPHSYHVSNTKSQYNIFTLFVIISLTSSICTWFSNCINYNSSKNSKYITHTHTHIYIYIYRWIPQLYNSTYHGQWTSILTFQAIRSLPPSFTRIRSSSIFFLISSIIHNINIIYHFCLTVRFHQHFIYSPTNQSSQQW